MALLVGTLVMMVLCLGAWLAVFLWVTGLASRSRRALRRAMTCPTCDSIAPHLHPAVQHGGEVQPCRDPFHERVTPENTPERIARVRALPGGARSPGGAK